MLPGEKFLASRAREEIEWWEKAGGEEVEKEMSLDEPERDATELDREHVRARGMRKKYTLLEAVKLERYPFQKEMRGIVQSPVYENFILFIVFLNCILLAVFNPSKISAKTQKILDFVETIFLFAFAAEALLYIVAYGVIRFKTSYLRNGWTILDGVVVVIGFLSWFGQGTSGVTGLRALRALRPLKGLKIFPGTRRVVKTVLDSMSFLKDAALLLLALIISFTVSGVSLWRGKLGGR